MTVLAEVVRSGFVEGRHHGSLVVLGADDTVLLALGRPGEPIFPRSANKPLQAAAMVDTGYIEAYGLQPTHVALSAASHNGEAKHLAGVRAMLAKAGIGESRLECPALEPLSEHAADDLVRAGKSPLPIHHNCSGKHAAMLATCRHRGWSLDGYRDPEHPLQTHIARFVAESSQSPVAAVGVDGCGAPVLAFSLFGLARAFSALATAAATTPAGRVALAMRLHPDLVGGTGRDVTTLMEAVPGLVAKEGVEGVYAAALPSGAAVAVKVDDGAARARLPVLVAALRLLGASGDEAVLGAYQTSPVLGGGGVVGAVRAAGPLAAYTWV